MNFSLGDITKAIYTAFAQARGVRQRYDVVPIPYTTSQQVGLQKACNGWTVINQGTTNVTVNGTIVLVPGNFVAVGGNEGEEYTGFLRISFANNAAPGNNALVLQKFYTGGVAFDNITV
jgi:hypothetical protein